MPIPKEACCRFLCLESDWGEADRDDIRMLLEDVASHIVRELRHPFDEAIRVVNLPTTDNPRAFDDRISRLSAAILRISASLDVATVLREAVEGACALTGTRSGAVATVDERGEVQDFVTHTFGTRRSRSGWRIARWKNQKQAATQRATIHMSHPPADLYEAIQPPWIHPSYRSNWPTLGPV